MTVSNHQYTRTLFIPSIPGQYKLWRKVITESANRANFVIQMGNLVSIDEEIRDKNDNNGSNAALLKYAMFFQKSSEKYVQLIGPNEIFALNAPRDFVNFDSLKILSNGWLNNDPTFHVACAINGKLVSHGGMTYGEWLSIGKPDDPKEAAFRINEKYEGSLYQGPCFKLGNCPNYGSNPIFADPIMEFYPSWVTAPEPAPFDQINGSGSMDSLMGRASINDVTNPLQYSDRIIHRKYGSYIISKGMEMLGLDLKLLPGVQNSSLPRTSSLYVEKLLDTNE